MIEIIIYFQLYGNKSIKYSYLKQIICKQLNGFKYSRLMWMIFKQIDLTQSWNPNRYNHSRSNGNERVLHTPQIHRVWASPPDVV